MNALRYPFKFSLVIFTLLQVNFNSSAQFTKLLDFDGVNSGNIPKGSLISDGTHLYGMTSVGGADDAGLIFKILPDGTGFLNIHDFDGNAFGAGGYPDEGTLIYDGTFLYGMVDGGGINGDGSIFKIMPDGTGYVTLHDFGGIGDGFNICRSLFFDGTFLYGMTHFGGANLGGGIIFKIMPDGTNYLKIFDFNDATGRAPNGSLVSDGIYLYGLTAFGATFSAGSIFKILPDGSGFMSLRDLDDIDGGRCSGSPILIGNYLYGMGRDGGTNSRGTIFRIMTDGTGFEKIHEFDVNENYPEGSLNYDGTFLYGMTTGGGINDDGTIFKIMPDGTSYIKLFDFAGDESGKNPAGSFINDAGFLYGMAPRGGLNDGGTIFKYSLTGSTTTITINKQPVNVTECNATTTSLTTLATGTTNISYQWQMREFIDGFFTYTDLSDGADYSGTASPTLMVNTFNVGEFRCSINGDLAAEVFTNTVTLILLPTTTPPMATNASNCSPGSFTLTASGGINGQYRWYSVPSGGTNISGEVNSNYVTPVLSTTTSYYVSINNGFCESTRTPIMVTIGGSACTNQPPTFMTTTANIVAEGMATIDLKLLVNDSDNNIDINSFSIIAAPSSGAATQIVNGILTVNYAGTNFLGADQLTIQVCDQLGSCTQQQVIINVVDSSTAELIVYSGISPNGDLFNEKWIIENIEVLSDTRENRVSIYNRWGDLVFETSNYDNVTRVFKGVNNNGNDLPSGTYFFKIEFNGRKEVKTGYLSLKK